MKPLLKWPGGKRFIAPILADRLGSVSANRYFEPFAGGAALFFALEPRNAVLSDTNEELINLYTVVRDNPEDLINALRRYRNSCEDYYRIRNSQPIRLHTRAARLYYLMRLSFNGIYRENQDGIFNVPYGRKTHLDVYDVNLIRAASVLLKNARTILCQDFRSTVSDAKKGDLIYCDPPYTVRHNNNGFVKYNRTLFSWEDQVELATVAGELFRRGCYVIISNADHKEVGALYKDFSQVVISRASVISASRAGRGATTERLMFSPNIAIGF